MSDLALGALSMQLKLDMEGLDTSVKKAVSGLDKIEQKADETAKKTEDVGKVLKDALKGEVIVNAGNRIGSTLQQVGGEFTSLGKTVTGVSAAMQGLFQGGLLGGGIATFGVAVSNVTQAFAEAEANSRRITEMWAKDLQGRIDQLGVIQARIDEINRGIAGASAVSTAAGVSASTGLSVDTAQQFDALDQAEMRQRRAQERFGLAQRGARGGGELAQQDLKLAAADLAEASAALRKLEADLGAQADRERADSLRRVTEEKNAKTQASKEAMQSALKEARNWMPEGLRTPGELARMARGDDGIDGPGGSIRREAADRAARDAGYKANALDTLRLDSPLKRIRETFDQAADFVTGGVLDSMRTFADDFADAMETAADVAGAATEEVWGQLAPKTFDVVSKALKGDIGGAIASALSNSIEFQAVGKALDAGLVDIVNALTEVLRPAVPVITMAIDGIVSLAKIVGDAVSMLMTLSGADKAIAMLFEVVKGISAVLAGAAASMQWALDALQNTFKNAAIGLLSIFGPAFQSQIDDMRASLVPQTGNAGDAFSKAFDAVWKVGFNAEQAAVGLGDAAAAADKVAQSFLNLPAGFKTNQALYNATSATSAPFGGFMPPPTAAQLPATSGVSASSGTGSGDVFNFYGPISVYGDDEFRNVVTVSAKQSGMATTGTTGGRPTNRSSPTPHAPNSMQPYTPATP